MTASISISNNDSAMDFDRSKRTGMVKLNKPTKSQTFKDLLS